MNRLDRITLKENLTYFDKEQQVNQIDHVLMNSDIVRGILSRMSKKSVLENMLPSLFSRDNYTHLTDDDLLDRNDLDEDLLKISYLLGEAQINKIHPCPEGPCHEGKIVEKNHVNLYWDMESGKIYYVDFTKDVSYLDKDTVEWRIRYQLQMKIHFYLVKKLFDDKDFLKYL